MVCNPGHAPDRKCRSQVTAPTDLLARGENQTRHQPRSEGREYEVRSRRLSEFNCADENPAGYNQTRRNWVEAKGYPIPARLPLEAQIKAAGIESSKGAHSQRCSKRRHRKKQSPNIETGNKRATGSNREAKHDPDEAPFIAETHRPPPESQR